MPRHKEAAHQTCTVCGGTFYKPPSHLAKWPARTCSRTCAAVLRKRTVECTCEVCGTLFEVKAKRREKGFGRFCSKECNGQADRRRSTVTCYRCKTAFDVPNYRARRKLHFCSVGCQFDGFRAFAVPHDAEKFKGRKNAHLLGPACVRCGATDRLELDHIVPRFAGGKATADNVQTLCKSCNLRKYWHEDLPRYLSSPSSKDQ